MSKEASGRESLNLAGIAPPFARHSHGVEVPASARWVRTSGQLGLRADGTVPHGAERQDAICFARDAWLAEVAVLPTSTLMIVAGFTRADFLVEIEALAAA